MKSLQRFWAGLLVALAFFVSPLTASAAVDMFLKIDGIDGESSDPERPGFIDIESFSWGMSNARGANAPTITDLKVVAKVNKASPKLILACATGQHIKDATITCRKSGEQTDYFTVKFSDLIVSSYQTGASGSGSGSDVVPMDQISFNFTKIEMTYQPKDATGNPSGPPIVTTWPPETPPVD